MAEFLQTGLGITLLIVAQSLLIVAFVMISLLFLVYGDRKIWAAVQMRRGPNVVGPFGLLQSVADALKYVVKEIVVPAGADRAVFFLAPLLSFVLAILAWAVIPFDSGWVLADINVAILFVFAASSLEVYGVIMGGWASNSKYPFLGSLRSAAQMISYEVSLGLIIIGIIISTGSMSFSAIVHAQSGDYGLLNWYWLPHFPMVFLFFISASVSYTHLDVYKRQELDRAIVAPSDRIPENVVTMNTRLVYSDESTGTTREIELVYPNEADSVAGRVSVSVSYTHLEDQVASV